MLTQTARHWFEQTADICPNHVLEYPDPNVVVGKRLDILPVEIVVRGYLAGTTGTSILTMYKQGLRAMYGVTLPDGLRDNERLPEAIITPTSKAFDGGHDEPLSAAQIVEEGLLTREQWDTVSRYALALFARGQALAAQRGLILADTKYEFGTDTEGTILLADEIHTPDSSRYWMAGSYAARFEFVRNWVVARCDPYTQDLPPIPAELIAQTSDVYVRAFETITGQAFVPPPAGEPPLERIRRNLARFF